jgi:hypothetical protein
LQREEERGRSIGYRDAVLSLATLGEQAFQLPDALSLHQHSAAQHIGHGGHIVIINCGTSESNHAARSYANLPDDGATQGQRVA